MHRPYIVERPGTTKAVLMIHGICGSPRRFDFLLPGFDDSWSVYNISLDGHGGSVLDFGRTSMKKWKAQVRQMLSKLCSQYETVLLVGFSMGTLLEIDALGEYPGVKGMLLLNVPTRPRMTMDMFFRTLRMYAGKPRMEDPYEAAYVADTGMELNRRIWEYFTWIPQYWELLALGRKCRGLAARIAVPTYAYFGQRDELVSPRSAKDFQNQPHVTVRLLDTAGHCWYSREDKQRVLDDLAQLMNRIENDK